MVRAHRGGFAAGVVSPLAVSLWDPHGPLTIYIRTSFV